MACEKCWGDAYIRSMGDATKSQGEHYRELLIERESNPCSAHEQRGLDAAADPAQSAPSAEQEEEICWSKWRASGPVWTRWGISSEREREIAKAYAALRTAQLERERNEWKELARKLGREGVEAETRAENH